MIKMEETWRWFGPKDPVSLQDVKQAGATGVVSALHQVPHGEVWEKTDIEERKAIIGKAGLTWSVVESITVHEDIKTRSGDYKKYIENYKTSIRNVAAASIPVITYNFMPVNDWTRTSLNHKMMDGSHALYFNWIDLAIFDLYILKRANAADSYSPEILKKAEERFSVYSANQLEDLAGVVMFGIPGEQKASTEGMRKKLELYTDINREALQDNLCDFLAEVSPVAQECKVKLAMHPDDPPFPILGLPRIVSSLADYQHFLNKVDIPANGVCFCTGSLGASAANDLPAMVNALADRIHFVHLRNVKKDAEGNFYEADHLGGDNDMYAVMKNLLIHQQKTGITLPYRPDHGHQMLDDLKKITNPGYSAIGRLRGLAEMRGLELGIARSLAQN